MQVEEIEAPELRNKIEKHIGELVKTENFYDEVKSEGYDSVLLVFSSSENMRHQDIFVTEFIDCKSRFKKMRNRSVRFFAIDLNTDFGVNLGMTTEALPVMLVYPAYHKTTAVYQYSGKVDGIAMAKFIHSKVDLKFELKDQFF